jgi:hypothetical protein
MTHNKSFIATLMQSVLSIANISNRKTVFADQLPMAAKSFITNYFQGKSIAFVEKNNDMLANGYTVSLNNGTNVSFNSKGEWTKISNMSEQLPASFIPDAIYRFAFFCFPLASITMINRRATGYYVGLSNEVVLKFNREGVIYGMVS